MFDKLKKAIGWVPKDPIRKGDLFITTDENPFIRRKVLVLDTREGYVRFTYLDEEPAYGYSASEWYFRKRFKRIQE